MFRVLNILLWIMLISFGTFGNNTISIQNAKTVYKPKTLSFYRDSTNVLTIDEIDQITFGKDQGRYSDISNGVSMWVKLHVIVDTTQIENLVLFIDQANIDIVEMYYQDNKGNWQVKVLGNDKPFSERTYQVNHLIFDVPIHNLKANLYLRLRNHVPTTYNIMMGDRNVVLEHENNLNSLFIFLIGIIFAVIIYNLFLYLSLQEPIYLVYVISSILTGVLQMVLYGIGYQYFWPNIPKMQDFASELFTILGTIAGLIFMRMFLKTRNNARGLDRVANLIIGFYIILLFVVWADIVLVNRLLILLQPLLAIYIIITAVVIVIKGYEPAKFYLRAWAIFLLAIIVFVMAERGIIERNYFTTLSLIFGSAVEVMLLSFALASRINILKRKQKEAIANSLRLEKEKASLIVEQNIELEEKVAKRTHELKEAVENLNNKNQELEEAYSNLKNTQSQLVHAEKMSSLGQLTAGIAHEINNPINFVSSNITPLKRDIDDLLSLYKETEDYIKEFLSESEISELNTLKSKYDFEYVVEEIDQLLDGMSDGAYRTVEIIRGLKLFSRLDEDDLKRVNLLEGINSTLILLNSAVKHHVEVVKNYADIPEVECFGGKMNQVFMNILSNAVQAIKGAGIDNGKIEISAKHKDGFVVLSFKDNGPGMSKEVQEKLFEPFFTTKPVGEGTGLGLSIVYKIIDKINGKIEVNSEEGKGTEFIITIPVKSSLNPEEERNESLNHLEL